MGQAKPIRPSALVVEDEEMQRELISMLLEECEFQVIQCESAEAAVRVLDKMGGCLSMLFTDVELAGPMSGVELAYYARRRFPELSVIVTSGNHNPDRLPEHATFMPKPWRTLDVMREAERAAAH